MITEEQRLARRNHLGSSDAAAAIGLCPWSTPYKVWRAKVHGDEKATTDRMSEGNILERAVLDWAALHQGLTFTRDSMKVHENGILAANFDGLGDSFVVEAKWRPKQDRLPPTELYGRAGSSQIPQTVLVQVMHQLYVAGPEFKTAYVAVLRGWDGLGFGLYKVRRDEELIEMIVSREIEFWNTYVVTKQAPPLPENSNDNGDDTKAA